MKKWEYFWFFEAYDYEGSGDWYLYTIDVNGYWEKHDMSDRLNIMDEWGEKGWELVSITTFVGSEKPWLREQVFINTNKVYYFFKREKEKKKGD